MRAIEHLRSDEMLRRAVQAAVDAGGVARDDESHTSAKAGHVVHRLIAESIQEFVHCIIPYGAMRCIALYHMGPCGAIG